MSVLSGYSKYKRYILTSSGYKLCSHWTSSNTVHFDDGNTAQTKLGAISGITDSLTATSSNVALSAKAGKNLQDQVTELNTGLIMDFGSFAAANTSYTIDESSFIAKSNAIRIINLRIAYTGSFPSGNYYTVATATVKPSRMCFLQATEINSNVQCHAYFYQDGSIKVRMMQGVSNPVLLIGGCFI